MIVLWLDQNCSTTASSDLISVRCRFESGLIALLQVPENPVKFQMETHRILNFEDIFCSTAFH